MKKWVLSFVVIFVILEALFSVVWFSTFAACPKWNYSGCATVTPKQFQEIIRDHPHRIVNMEATLDGNIFITYDFRANSSTVGVLTGKKNNPLRIFWAPTMVMVAAALVISGIICLEDGKK